MQRAVDAEADVTGVAPRLEMDVAGALLERVLEQPVADVDDVLVVGVELAAAAELHQLLEVGNVVVAAAVIGLRAFHRTREIVEFDQVALDVERARDHAPDVEPQDLLELVFPFPHVRLAGRDHRFLRVDLDRQDAVARGVGVRHDAGHGREIDLERIDMHVRQFDVLGQPLRQRFQMQYLAGLPRILPFLLGDHHQRVHVGACEAPIPRQPFGIFSRYQPIRDKVGEQPFQRQLGVRSG